ncbi:MAG: hypothetical protein D8M58_00060 [Calditrichaeota bacterium]|nr:MAG: hypothetical protein DWQ03_07020 [Calditrichota bacterium]MBL1203762.1 hypothetical protein [Calditrichota bacterium]NOG43592.1 hypothetical protein [Calditrichota bacterium]
MNLSKTTFLFTTMSLLLLILNSCSNSTENGKTSSFEMYYLENTLLSFEDVGNEEINKVDLEMSSFITDDNIQTVTAYYNSDGKIMFFQFRIEDTDKLSLSSIVRPFVLIVNGRRYLSEYWPTITASLPKSILFYKVNGNTFELHNRNSDIKNIQILNSLEELGVEIQKIYFD